MLSKFFITQWKYPVAGDWVLQAKEDLADLGIQENLHWIKMQSDFSFKNLVKRKTKEFAFYKFLETKERHTKLDNLWYPELALQDYLKLETMTAFEAKTVFSYRTRGALYSDNYRGVGGLSPCHMCLLHLDCQALAFQCPVVRSVIQIGDRYEDTFNSSVCNSLAKTLVKIDRLRDEHRNQKAIT